MSGRILFAAFPSVKTPLGVVCRHGHSVQIKITPELLQKWRQAKKAKPAATSPLSSPSLSTRYSVKGATLATSQPVKVKLESSTPRERNPAKSEKEGFERNKPDKKTKISSLKALPPMAISAPPKSATPTRLSADFPGLSPWASPQLPWSYGKSSPGELPLLSFLDYRTDNDRQVLYTADDQQADEWLKSNTKRLFAFDAEWKPNVGIGPAGKISLLQLGDDTHLYLFHIHHMKQFPLQLRKILEDSNVLKVGCNIRNDGRKLFEDWRVGCHSMIELGSLMIQVQDGLTSNRAIRSMASLTRELLNRDVAKDPNVRTGNWERRSLPADMLAYAANDVYVTYVIADRIKALQKSRPPQKYTIPLATVDVRGGTVLIVQGSLQERQDKPATEDDIIDRKVFGKTERESERARKKLTALPVPKHRRTWMEKRKHAVVENETRHPTLLHGLGGKSTTAVIRSSISLNVQDP